MPTVALLAPTGMLGGNFLSVLGPLHTDNRLKLVLIHRGSSKVDVGKVPLGVETRLLDVETASEADIVKAVDGVDTLVSALSGPSHDAVLRFLSALSKTSLGAYIPSDYSIPWNHEEEADPVNAAIYAKVQQNNKARELGIPLTIVHNGVFQPNFFIPQLVGVDAKANTLRLYGNAAVNRIPITSPRYLAEAVGQIVVRDPKEFARKSFTVMEFETTGTQVANALEAAHGQSPQFVAVTNDQLEVIRHASVFGALGVAIRRKWSNGDFDADDLFNPEGIDRGNIQKAVDHAIRG